MESKEGPIELPESAEWHVSTVGEAGAVEVAVWVGGAAVRDAKDHGSGPILQFSAQEWEAFLGGVRGGEFDL
jgi:hypothetical protein